MEKDKEDSSIEELDPFLGSSSRSEHHVRSHRGHDILLYCLVILLGISLGSHFLTYIYIHRASYLDAACVRHTQQNRMLALSSSSMKIWVTDMFPVSHPDWYPNSLSFSSLRRDVSCQLNICLPPSSISWSWCGMGRPRHNLKASSLVRVASNSRRNQSGSP